jgi:hypothetical protein
MIPIKIQCGCGQKYVFDVEPVGGCMAYAVACPVCGADGTAAANVAIANHEAPPVPPDLRLRIGTHISPPVNVTPLAGTRLSTARAKPLNRAILRNRWFVAALGACLLLLLVLVGTVYAGRSHTPKPEPASRPGNPGEKFHHTLAELNAWYVEPPAGQNAATILSHGFGALHLGNGAGSDLPLLGKATLPPLGTPLPAAQKSAMTALVRANREALQFFAQGAKYEQSRYPIDLNAGFEVLLPHLPKLKSAALMLELSAVLHGEAQEGKPAAEDLLAALGLARSLENEPSLLSQGVRDSNVSTVLAACEQTINRTTLPPESLNALMKSFKHMEELDARGEGFNRGLVAERAIWMALLDAPQKLLEALSLPGVDIPADDRERTFARLQKGGQLKTEQQTLEKTFEQLMDARKASFPARLKADDLIRQQIADANRKKLVVLGVLLPAFAGKSAKEAESLARLRLGMAAVALEQFRAAHDNKYPTDLSQLVPDCLPETLLDPFDGAPLRYRKTGAGYLVYSIGPDLKDNSGERLEGKPGDIVFAVASRVRDLKRQQP